LILIRRRREQRGPVSNYDAARFRTASQSGQLRSLARSYQFRNPAASCPDVVFGQCIHNLVFGRRIRQRPFDFPFKDNARRARHDQQGPNRSVNIRVCSLPLQTNHRRLRNQATDVSLAAALSKAALLVVPAGVDFKPGARWARACLDEFQHGKVPSTTRTRLT
jgi:hypothetical protein